MAPVDTIELRLATMEVLTRQLAEVIVHEDVEMNLDCIREGALCSVWCAARGTRPHGTAGNSILRIFPSVPTAQPVPSPAKATLQ